MKNILVILGTRPEAIKLAPVILELRKHAHKYNVIVCNTEQQKELSNQALSFFEITADINLNTMIENQSLSYTHASILQKLSSIYTESPIDLSIVQGDTSTVLCGALASFYNKIPICHIEAGLRSFNLKEPFPEEGIRQMVSKIASIHFTPTALSAQNLINENIDPNSIIISGNTVIDAINQISPFELTKAKNTLIDKNIPFHDNQVLITVHRRENHGSNLDSILSAIRTLSIKYPEHDFIFPVHPNPNIKTKVIHTLSNIKNIHILDPLNYPEIICIMKNAKLILTDSGGIQEEAPACRVPTLILRETTERSEGVQEGLAKLIGANKELIEQEAGKILRSTKADTRIKKENPYGDGKASLIIEQAISNMMFK